MQYSQRTIDRLLGPDIRTQAARVYVYETVREVFDTLDDYEDLDAFSETYWPALAALKVMLGIDAQGGGRADD